MLNVIFTSGATSLDRQKGANAMNVSGGISLDSKRRLKDSEYITVDILYVTACLLLKTLLQQEPLKVVLRLITSNS